MRHSDRIIALISDIRDKANRLILNELEKHGVKGLAPSHGSILQLLYRSDEDLTMQQIATRIGRDKSTVTALVTKLITLGYVEKRKHPDDSRSAIVSLTPQGQQLQPVFEAVSQTLLQRVYRDFTQDEREVLMGKLEMIDRNL